MSNNNEFSLPRTPITLTTRENGLPPRFASSITAPPRSTWATRTCQRSLCTFQTLLGRNLTWILFLRVSTPLQGTAPAGETILSKFCTTSFTFSIRKAHGCKEFKDPMTRPLGWGCLRRRPHLRRSVQGIGVAVSLTFVRRPTLTNTKQPLAMVRSGSFWRTNSSRWMFTPTKCMLFSWKTTSSSVKSASRKSLKEIIFLIPSLEIPRSATAARKCSSKIEKQWMTYPRKTTTM